ncbi:hypothetical protein LguiA_011287 [Lonicera macranthoides]
MNSENFCIESYSELDSIRYLINVHQKYPCFVEPSPNESNKETLLSCKFTLEYVEG